MRVIKTLKICCVLDPSRAMAAYETTEDSCWVETTLPGREAEVEMLVGSRELEGFVFPSPSCPRTVRMYDWVSPAFHRSTSAQRLARRTGVRRLLLLPTGGVLCGVHDLEAVFRPDH
jgi:hypothetical protein